MRSRNSENGLTISAVIGTSAALLSFDMEEASSVGLLGFTIEREDHTENEKYYLKGFKYFPETAGDTGEGQLFSSYEHPIQSFLWEDFSVKPNHDYSYTVTPVYGKPKYLVYEKGCTIRFTTPTSTAGEHSVHFNRGVAGSLAYARKFRNLRPDSPDLTDEESAEALKWLSNGLLEAMIGFIESAKDSTYQLRAAVYELEYLPVLEAFRDAFEERNVDVQIIFDARGEKLANNKAITEAGLPRNILIPREAEADKSYIAHNKFIVLIQDGLPKEVWTGSTNITQKGIFGQCNVGHIVRNPTVAQKYLDYWELLKTDPLNQDLENGTVAIQSDLIYDQIQKGTTVFFSPRKNKTLLQTYADYMANSQQLVCGMFPFSFSKKMKAVIQAPTNNLKYIVIDKKDKHTTLTSNDVDNLIVYGTYLKDGLYDWLEETHAGLALNAKPGHVGTNFIHNKVILIDPLGEEPIVISGSANFSDNSIGGNDENTLVIRGDKDVADLYFTEFFRIFNHYYARFIALKMADSKPGQPNPIHLKTLSKDWVPAFYKPTALKFKRKLLFVNMKVT